MSKKSAAEFLVAITKSPVLLKQMQKVYEKHYGESNDPKMAVSLIEQDIIPIAKNFQFDFTPEELILVFDELEGSDSKDSLNENDLDEVAGGFGGKSFAFALAALVLAPLAASSASAFDAKSHSYTTESGVDLISSVKHDDENYKKFFTEDLKKALEKSCNLPDQDEIDGVYKCHFYSPDTGKNFMGEDDTALSRLERHYNEAVRLYKNGKTDESYEQLARALHFLEDLNVPVHTHNQHFISTILDAPRNHQKFEKYCDNIRETVKISSESLTKDELESNQWLSITDLGKSSAFVANENYWKIDKDFEKNVDSVAKETIKNAQKAVAKALDMFYRDAVNVKKHEILDTEVKDLGNGYVAERHFSTSGEEKTNNGYKKSVYIVQTVKKDSKEIAMSSFTVDFWYNKSGTVKIISKSMSSGAIDTSVRIMNDATIINKSDNKLSAKTVSHMSKKTSKISRLLGLNCSWKEFAKTDFNISCDANGQVSFK